MWKSIFAHNWTAKSYEIAAAYLKGKDTEDAGSDDVTGSTDVERGYTVQEAKSEIKTLLNLKFQMF